MAELSREIVKACESLGFASAGVCAAAEAGRPEALREWLAGGFAGSMSWMHEWTDQRLDIRKLHAADSKREMRSVIMVADQCAQPGAGGASESEEPAEATGRIARYARGRDYHDVVRRRLHTLADALRARFRGEEFRAFVDTGPVLEREHAARAGLGFIGKHTLLIDPRRGGAGSYLLLGGIATTIEIDVIADRPAEVESHCGSCTRCIDACPTGAIEPYRVDARRCISYLTIEHQGLIDTTLQPGMGDWIFGCDVCQDVCPFNADPPGSGGVSTSGGRVHPLYREREGMVGGRLRLLEVLRWSRQDRQVALTVSAGKRASLEMIRRNAVIAAGNAAESQREGELDEELRQIAERDPSEVVRTTARQVLERLRGGTPSC